MAMGEISFTADVWLSKSLNPYLAVTAHWIGQDMETGMCKLSFKSALIMFHYILGSNTGIAIARALLHLIDQAGIHLNRLGHFTLDNAANNDAAAMAELSRILLEECQCPQTWKNSVGMQVVGYFLDAPHNTEIADHKMLPLGWEVLRDMEVVLEIQATTKLTSLQCHWEVEAIITAKTDIPQKMSQPSQIKKLHSKTELDVAGRIPQYSTQTAHSGQPRTFMTLGEKYGLASMRIQAEEWVVQSIDQEYNAYSTSNLAHANTNPLTFWELE
ncbi:hypothetical protein BS17DRAFT_766592 [Gyrodon lividus]|nr:hypothetical protein BS17DRAFT_766592 [Gyrodon lividus]